MSEDGLPFFEGFESEYEGSEDEYSDPNVITNVENLQPIDEANLDFEEAQNYLEGKFPGRHNLSLSFNSAYYTTAVPIVATSTPVGSPETSRVGALVDKFEPRKQSKPIVDCEKLEFKIKPSRSSPRGAIPEFGPLMAKGKANKAPVKMDLSIYAAQVKLLDAEVQKLADKFKTAADKDPRLKEDLNKVILENTVMIDRIKRKSNLLNNLTEKCENVEKLKELMKLENLLLAQEAQLLDLIEKAKDLLGGEVKVTKETSSHLPKLDIPKFGGEMRAYKLWKQRFETITSGTAENAKKLYLIGALEGDASEWVQ